MLTLTIGDQGYAASATWRNNPATGDWNTAGNWQPSTVPNGPSDTATFAASSKAAITLSANTEVNGITFNSNASGYSISAQGLTLITSGTGITNNSVLTQGFQAQVSATGVSGAIDFLNNATAGTGTTLSTFGPPVGQTVFAYTQFFNNSTLGSAHATNNGSIVSNVYGGGTYFWNTSTAGQGVITNNSGATTGAYPGFTVFLDSSTANSATIHNLGSSINGAFGGRTDFFTSATAGAATVTSEGSSVANTLDLYRGLTYFHDTTSAANANFINNGSTASTTYGGRTEFFNNSTAGGATFTNNSGVNPGAYGGSVRFNDTSTAANGTFTNHGAQFSGVYGSFTIFLGSSTADNGIFTNEAGQVSGAYPGLMQLQETSTGADAVITNDGATVSGAFGGELDVFDTATLGNATVTLNGGSNGGGGGILYFIGDGSGGTARVITSGNAFLDLSDQNTPGPTIGSLEGNGSAFLGSVKLTIGSNNLSTTFAGIAQDGGIDGGTGGSLGKTGTGTLTLSNANTYTGGTTVSQGALLVTNRTGSATGTGAVTVNGGIFGGTGKVSGAVTVGGATTAASLAPGVGPKPGRLTTTRSLTFNARGKYQVGLNSTRAAIDQVVAKGVTITTGATISVADAGNTALPHGTVFTIINNTAATPINGTFNNLPNGSTLTIGSNTYLVSYTGGTGNDLTLTVQ